MIARGCRWLWMVVGGVGGCGWLWVVVDGCGWLWLVAYFGITHRKMIKRKGLNRKFLCDPKSVYHLMKGTLLK